MCSLLPENKLLPKARSIDASSEAPFPSCPLLACRVPAPAPAPARERVLRAASRTRRAHPDRASLFAAYTRRARLARELARPSRLSASARQPAPCRRSLQPPRVRCAEHSSRAARPGGCAARCALRLLPAVPSARAERRRAAAPQPHHTAAQRCPSACGSARGVQRGCHYTCAGASWCVGRLWYEVRDKKK